MALSRAKNMTRIFPPTVLALQGSFCVLKNWPCLSHFSAGRRLDLYGLLLVSLWLLPPHLPCFPHFFRGRRLDPAPLALFPALLPRSPLGSIWAPACAPMAFPGSVSRTSSALAAWIRMDSCLDPYYGFCRPTGPLFRTSSAGAAWIWVPALIPMASPAPLALFHALLPRSPSGSVCCMNCPLLC